jgi:hypothetical protein
MGYADTALTAHERRLGEQIGDPLPDHSCVASVPPRSPGLKILDRASALEQPCGLARSHPPPLSENPGPP